MEKKIHNAILNHYTELYYKFGKKPASLGWPRGRQNIRFRVMSEIGNLNNSKILDVGCGFGDFLSYIKSKKIRAQYVGIDINPIFIKIAKIRNPKNRFQVRDIEKNKFREKFDWSFAIGTTNKAGSYEYIRNLLKEMLKISKKGVAMDFMSTYVDFKRKGSFHASPEMMLKIAKSLSKRVVIRHDYLPFEFCVYIFKNDEMTKNFAFKKC